MTSMVVENQHIIVIGGGISGLAVCRFLLAKKAQITLADSNPVDKLSPEVGQLATQGIELLLNGELPVANRWQLAIKSPGVPPTTPLIQMLRQAGVPVIGELELAYLFTEAPFVAITGTNGKTTTTTLTYQMLADAGREALLGGNIGRPLVDVVEGYQGLIVAEVSSFQAEDCRQFAPHVAMLLNIAPDHLDRHGTLENYQLAKEQIFQHQRANDFAVLNYDDPRVRPTAQRVPSQVIYFSRQQCLTQGVYVEQGQIVIADGQKKMTVLPIADIYIKGGHNLENALAASAAAYVCGLTPEQIAHTLRTFKGVAHRLEFVAEIKGVTYVNDSKGTNPDSTTKALLAYEQPIVLIAGGRNKGSDFTSLMEIIKQKVVFLSLVGEAKDQFKAAAEAAGYHNYVLNDSFEEAVAQAIKAAQPGQVVMLSPACASWDMFKNYEVRGDLFKQLVLAQE